MAISVSGGAQALMDASVIIPIHLVSLAFKSGTQYLTTWPLDIVWNGHTWKGMGELGEIGEMKESEDGTEEKITLALSPVNLSNLYLALGNVSDYINQDALIYFALLDPVTHQLASTPALRFAGLMDQVGVEIGENSGKITMTCHTGSYAARNNPTTFRLNDTQHQERHPGELGLSYVQSLIETPPVWLSKTFQASQM